MEPGVQTPEQTLANASRLLPRLGLAAGAAAAPLRPGGALRLGLPDPAHARREGARRPERHRRSTSPTCTPGARSTCPAPAGSASTPPRACWPAKATSRWPARPTPSSAAPIEGAVDEAEVEFGHEMTVTRIHESPRVTKPYTEEQWAEVLALGDAVDRELAGRRRAPDDGRRADLRRHRRPRRAPNGTPMRSAPPSAATPPSWCTSCAPNTAQGGFLHFGQGKWYPGEQLPRWALSIFWRADGQPLWHNPALFADERDAHPLHQRGRAAASPACWRTSSGLTDRFVQPGYEDVYYYLWRERRLPVNVDPFDSKLDDEMERVRLRRVFTQKLDAVIGYMLPIEAANADARCARARRPGLEDRPLVPARRPHVPDPRRFADGLPPAARLAALGQQGRLPLPGRARPDRAARAAARRDRLPCALRQRPAARRPTSAPCPTPSARRSSRRPRCASRPPPATRPLRARGRLRPHRRAPAAARRIGPLGHAHRAVRGGARPAPRQRPGGREASAAPRACSTSSCRRSRGWRTTSTWSPRSRPPPSELGVQIVLEGYPPPRDPRLKMLQVTPDPGVIEVNIHPAHNWRELVDHTEFLYNAAFETRLSAEKFMTDGRHTGTGGGNHFVLGGATPADSPFLRRPELLGEPAALLAQPPVAELPVLGHVHRPDQPGAARRRGAQRPGLRARDRAAARSRATARSTARTCRPGWSTARCATSWSTSPATRTAASSASTSSTRPTPPPAAWACWSCAPSRCRRMRA